MKVSPQSFYRQPTITVASRILGCILRHVQPQGTTAGRIVETEAYLSGDPAARSFRGKTERNAVLFGPPGHAHVYLVYGLHLCFNIVTGDEGTGEAILIRALEPCEGISLMGARRGTTDLKRLCSGPGRLTKALNITRACNGKPVYKEQLQVGTVDDEYHIKDEDIVQAERVGITHARERPLRFYVKGSGYVSGR